MKKKVSPIKLHNLSETEMERRELNLLRGGSGTENKCRCVMFCTGSNCTCPSGDLSSAIKQIDLNHNDERQSNVAVDIGSRTQSL